MAIQLNNNIKVNAGKPIDVKYLDPSTNLPYVSESGVTTAVPIAERHIGLTVNINNSEYWFASGVTSGDLVLKIAASGSTINGAQNVGTGTGNIYSGVTNAGIINLRTLRGSGDTVVSTSGDTVVVYTTGGTSLNDGILRFDAGEQTFQPYSAFTTGVTFYYGDVCPTGTTRLGLNARLNVTELRLSTGHTVSGTTHIPGDMYWDQEDSTVTLQQTADVKQQIGQELFIKAINKTGSDIENGSVVYISGSFGGRATIGLTSAASDQGDKIDEIIGVATEDIDNDQEGFVTTLGLVRDINTSGFTEGDIVYLDTNIPGNIINTKPTYPDYIIEVGIVTNVDSVNGRIYVRVVNLSTTPNVRGVVKGNGGSFSGTTLTDVVVGVGAGTYLLPPSPIVGQEITIVDRDGDAGNGWEIIIDGNGQPINSNSNVATPNYTAVINTNFGSLTLIYIGYLGTAINYGWRITTSTP